MTKNRFIQAALVVAFVFGTIGCQDQLDVGNPNSPTPGTLESESGAVQMCSGGVYINGFFNGDNWLGNSYFSLPMGYNELMADNVGASASNNQVTTIAQPDYIILDDGVTKLTNPSPTVGIIRTYNTRPATGAGNNALHYQWLNMYAMNNAMNLVLSKVDGIVFAGDAVSKKAAIKAWCYFWKGYAYASIGSKYYAGLIVNEWSTTNGNYVGHDAIITESNTFYNLAATTLDAVVDDDVYAEVLGAMIPPQNQAGRGGVPSRDEWKRNINTLLARNIIFNKLSPFVNNDPAATVTGTSMSGVMSATDWATVKSLTTDGIKAGDVIFVGYTVDLPTDFFSAGGGTVASLSATAARTSTFKVSERVVENFKAGDWRRTNNFDTTTTDRYSHDYTYGTRWTLVDGAKGLYSPLGATDSVRVWKYADREAGAYELVIAGSWEENALMLAEANIRTNDIDGGTTLIDAVRTFMGAGVAPIGLGATLPQALNELAMERRVALLFRGLSFYDNRRWGWTYDISKGGGSYGNTVVQGTTRYTNVTINYNFMDYWDVPAAEAVLNPPDGSTIPLENPNF